MELLSEISTLLRSDGKLNNWYKKKMSEDLHRKIIEATPNCVGGVPERVFWIRNNIHDYPQCECGESITAFSSATQSYSAFCSKACFSKYNGARISSGQRGMAEEAKKKMHRGRYQTRVEKYGSFLTPNYKKSIQAKYGVDNVSQLPWVKEKKCQTAMERFGETNYFKTEAARDATRIRNKSISRTMTPETMDKWRKSCKNRKEYLLPSGKKILVQGYENLALDILLEQYNENHIINSLKEVPIIQYVENGKIRKYFPDFFIPSANLIIEVKSTYTYKLHEENVERKREAVLSSGYSFMLMIFDGKGNLISP